MTHSFDELATHLSRLKPSADDVAQMLQRGELAQERNGHAEAKLVKQWYDFAPLAWRTLDAWRALELGVTERDIVIGFRLVELLALPAADRQAAEAAIRDETVAQRTYLERLRRQRDDLVRLAKAQGVPPKLFRVNLGEGDASNSLPGARLLIELVDLHGAKLRAPKAVAGIRERLLDAYRHMHESEMRQEAGKLGRKNPTARLRAVREALYALMLRLSRLGPVALPDASEEERSAFGLKVLHPSPIPSYSVDDDDEPVLDTIDRAAGLVVPKGNLAALALEEAEGPVARSG